MESLVSICVVSYNSAGTILETLDSIKGQTYKNIELIISDDNSKDNTVEIATEWLKNNSNRFTNTQLLTVEKNSGVTGNCNRAVKASKGEIVKIIAADDIFYPDYIESCTEYFLQNPECNVLFTKLTPFLENDKTDVISLPEDYDFLQLTQQEQHDRLIYNGLTILPTPACIYRKKILEQMNYFDEEIPMWEDGPMYFKLAENNIKMHLLDKEGIFYRISRNSISNKRPVSHVISISKFYFKYRDKYEKKNNFLKATYHRIKFHFGLHYKNKIARIIYDLTENHAVKQFDFSKKE